jgi:peptidoglycan/LPS O-acetylase OafA/YrhL
MEPPAQAQKAWPFRYEMIDGLRGLAALAVVMHHLLIAPVGHYAVMLFFVISGYCIAAAVEAGRRSGMGFGTFMWRRLRRIYPPYFFALVFYTLTRLVKVASGRYEDLARPWLDWVQNLTLTQWVTLPFHPVADAPQNPKLLVAAFWSLNYEDQFYLVMAGGLLLALRWRIPMPLVVAALAVAGLAWNCAAPGGWITGFFLEYWVHFALGALLFYVLCLFPGRAARAVFLAVVIVLGCYAAVRVFPWRPGVELRLRAYVEFVVVCAFTLFLYGARPFSAAISRSWFWRPVAALGAISYSLYLIHQFNLTLVAEVVTWMAPHAWDWVRSALLLGLHILLASVFWYCCERPFLNRAPRANPAPQAAHSIPTASTHLDSSSTEANLGSAESPIRAARISLNPAVSNSLRSEG